MLLIALCASALAGLAAADLSPTRPPPGQWLVAALLAGAGAACGWRYPLVRTAALLALAAALGAARGAQAADFSRPPPSQSAEAQQPPAESDPAALSALQSTLAATRAAARLAITRSLPEPQASLAAGVLLGGTGRLDPAFRLDLQRSGLSHLVAIDGFKQVVVTAALSALARRAVGPRLALLPTLTVIAGYTVLAGAHPSAIRAALMVGLASVATVGGRLADPLTSLALATLGMALVSPRVLLDVGLQLSLSATLGIVLLWPTLKRWLRLRRLPHWLAEPIGLTLAVTLACLPVTLSAFETVSLVSPLAHVVAIPLLPPVLLGAALLALAAPIPPVQALVAWLVWLPTSLLAGTIHLFGALPGAAVSTGRLPPGAAIALAGALLGCGIWHVPELGAVRRRWRHWRLDHRAVLIPMAGALGCVGTALVLAAMRPDGQLHVEPLALDTGQATFIRGPTGRSVLVVLGRADAPLLADLVAERLAVWEHKLDAVVVLDAPAERGLGVTLARYPADQLIRATPNTRLDVGAGQALEIASIEGRLAVSVVGSRSDPPTSAARPGSAG